MKGSIDVFDVPRERPSSTYQMSLKHENDKTKWQCQEKFRESPRGWIESDPVLDGPVRASYWFYYVLSTLVNFPVLILRDALYGSIDRAASLCTKEPGAFENSLERRILYAFLRVSVRNWDGREVERRFFDSEVL